MTTYSFHVSSESGLVTVKNKDTGDVVETIDIAEYYDNTDAQMQRREGIYGKAKKGLDDVSSIPTSEGPAKLAAFKARLEALTAGEWNKPREVGTRRSVDIRIEAFANVTGRSIADSQILFRGMSAEDKKRVYADQRIIDEVARLESIGGDVSPEEAGSVLDALGF